MLIKSLKLNNIRSYKDEIINFPLGSCLLSGDIGAGKSTILHAIEFALFGLRRKHLTGSSLLRKGTKQGEIELNFSINNKEIFIKRILKKNKENIEQTSGYIIINGIKQDLTAVELKSKILELLNYPMELLTKSKNLIYTYTVYTPQEEMKTILTEEPDIRLDVLRKVFGFNKYKLVRENCQIAFKEMRNKIKVYEGSTADLIEKNRFKDQYNEQLRLLNKELEHTQLEIDKLNQDYESKSTEMHILEKQKEELQDFRKSLMNAEIRYEEKLKNKDLIEQNIKNIEQDIILLKNKIEQLPIIKPLNDKLTIENQLKEKEELIYSIINQENAVKTKLSFLNATSIDLEKEVNQLIQESEQINNSKILLESLQEEIKTKENQLDQQKEFEQKYMSVTEKIQNFKLKKESALETIEKIMKLHNCPLCLQDVSHIHKDQIHKTETEKINQFNLLLNEIFKEKSLFENKLTQIHETLKIITAKELEINKLKIRVEMFDFNKIKEKEKQLQEIQIQKQEFKQQLLDVQKNNPIDIKQEIEKLKSELKLWQKFDIAVKEKSEYENRIKALTDSDVKYKEKLNDIEKELNDLNSIKKEFLNKIEFYKNLEFKFKIIREELIDLDKIEKELIVKKASKINGINNLKEQLSLLEIEINKKQKDLDDMNKLKQKLNWLDKSFIPLTTTIEKHIMAQVYQLFNELFKKWLNMLIEVELLSVSLDKEFTPIIYQNGFDVEYLHLSGGEKSSIALAYRLALNKVVNDLYHDIGTHDLIILDEPTDGFSREHLDKLKEVFDELNMTQLIIVSHETKIESFVENVIHITKNEHVSSIYC